MEIDSYLQDRSVHDYWTTPAENWLEYFMSHEKFENILKNQNDNKELLARLTTQFAEQAVITETEERALQAKNFPIEDVQYYQRKSACLWLCSMTCFAAIQWDYYYLLDSFDFLTVRPIIEQVKKIFNDPDLTSDATFGNWIWDKFIIAVAMRSRVPPPMPKPTVNNPLLKSSPDSVLIRFDANQKAIAELVSFVYTSIKNIELQTQEGLTIYVPGWHCFFDPYREGGSKALNIGIIGPDVLVEGAPKPRLAQQVDLISSDDVANRARFDLAVFYFDDDKQLNQSVNYIKAVNKSGTHPLISVDAEEVIGYRIALGITASAPEQIAPDKLLDDDQPHRKLGTKRIRQLAEADERSQRPILIANIACDVIQQQPILVRQLISKDHEFFVHALFARLPKIKSDLERRRIFALLNYFCATVFGFKSILQAAPNNVFPKEWLRDMVTPTPRTATPTPQKDIITALITRGFPDPFWTMITSFNVAEITKSVEILTRPNPKNPNYQFKIPTRFRFSEVFGEFVGSGNRTIDDLNAILIGKATQLAKLHSCTEWENYINPLTQVLAAGNSKFLASTVIEAMNVRNSYYNQRLHFPWEAIDIQQYNIALGIVKKAFTLPCLAFPTLTKEALAFCLNTKEFEYLVRLDLSHPILTFAKLLAAFGTRSGQMEGMHEFFLIWFNHMKPLFEAKTKRERGEAAANREIAKSRAEFISFIKLISEPSLLLFLISFFAHMFNSVVVADKKPQLKIFVQQSLLPADFDFAHPHAEAISECLTAVLERGIENNPCNAFWIRTAADFKYAKGDMEEAGRLYVEALLACCPNGQPPYPDNVIDDTFWTKLRVCLNRMKLHTMGALVCQGIKGKEKKDEEYKKAAAVSFPKEHGLSSGIALKLPIEIVSNNPSLDPGSECLSMLFDLPLAEELSHVYDALKQFNNLARLQYWTSKPALNPSNRLEIIFREQNRRCEHLIQNLAATLFETHL